MKSNIGSFLAGFNVCLYLYPMMHVTDITTFRYHFRKFSNSFNLNLISHPTVDI